jgi:soluble cytochrome b562
MQFIIDDWYEMLIIGCILLLALWIIYETIKVFFSNGGKVKTKGATIMGSNKEVECSEYVKEHTTILINMQKSLLDMEKHRDEARKENSETNKAIQAMFKTLAMSMDGLIEAFQKNNIGNGNLEKARKSLSKMYDIQDGYLINQL